MTQASASMPPRLILGSASPRRKQLLTQIGVVPDVIQPADINEDVHPGELPRPYVQRVCREKALALRHKFPNDFILSADTSVCVGRRILGKPKDIHEAEKFLNLISGRRHRVLTACALLSPKMDTPLIKISETAVKVTRLHANDIKAFLKTDEWQGKAGAYSIQGQFARYICWLQGSYAGVMGLDVHHAYALLRGNGWQTL